MTGDICPTGWRLPTGGGSGEYVSLTNAVGGANIMEKNRPRFAVCPLTYFRRDCRRARRSRNQGRCRLSNLEPVGPGFDGGGGSILVEAVAVEPVATVSVGF